MTSHKFNVGQRVSFHPGIGGLSYLRGSYTVVRLLPSEMRNFQYRVKSDHDSHERVVQESQLAAGSVASSPLDPWSIRTKMA